MIFNIYIFFLGPAIAVFEMNLIEDLDLDLETEIRAEIERCPPPIAKAKTEKVVRLNPLQVIVEGKRKKRKMFARVHRLRHLPHHPPHRRNCCSG